MIKIIAPIALISLLVSCGPNNRVYEKHKDLSPNLEWKKSDVRTFEVDIDDISIPYNLSLALRYAQGYPYDKARIQVTHINPSGKELTRSYDLKIREENGDYIGEPGFDIWDSEHLIEEGILFNEAGKYTFKIEHDMPTDPLVMVMEVGFILDKAIVE